MCLALWFSLYIQLICTAILNMMLDIWYHSMFCDLNDEDINLQYISYKCFYVGVEINEIGQEIEICLLVNYLEFLMSLKVIKYGLQILHNCITQLALKLKGFKNAISCFTRTLIQVAMEADLLAMNFASPYLYITFLLVG